MWLRGLSIRHCHYSGLGCCCDVGSTPGPELPQAWLEEKKKKPKNLSLPCPPHPLASFPSSGEGPRERQGSCLFSFAETACFTAGSLEKWSGGTAVSILLAPNWAHLLVGVELKDTSSQRWGEGRIFYLEQVRRTLAIFPQAVPSRRAKLGKFFCCCLF